MDIQTLKQFFGWCTFINGLLLSIWITTYMLIPEIVYNTQNYFFPIPKETFNIVFYSFLGLYKIIFLIFNAVPYIALLIIVSKMRKL